MSKPWRHPDAENYGGPKIAPVSLLASKGLCERGKKCIRKNGHDGDCWPKDEEN
jgi:hypothetical protein